MGSLWGRMLKVSVFGESHGEAIGTVLDGLPPGFEIDIEELKRHMKRRAPGNSQLSTPRKETDEFEIVSGYFEGKTTGTPLTAIIRNENTRSKDYSELKRLMRPGHADYTGIMRYNGYNDYRGGGHFSGRITAPLVLAGSICRQILERQGTYIGSHIKSIASVEDDSFDENNMKVTVFEQLSREELPMLNKDLQKNVEDLVTRAKKEGDSVGGIVECSILGLKAGIGDPFFDSVESVLSHLMFSIPSVKGVEFGAGFQIAKMKGSEANDQFYYDDGTVKTRTNNNGGVIGGITNGMPIVFRVAVKPTASISRSQKTVDIVEKRDTTLEIKGRHDPVIVPRVVPVVEAAAAIGIMDLMLTRAQY